jgi:NAD(P)H dehydrogenase (quinone)
MILITGAAGKTGRSVLRSLVLRGGDVRVFVRHQEQGEALKAMGAHDAALGSLDDLGAVRSAVRGCRAVYHIAPNVHPQEITFAQTVLDALRSNGTTRLVYHSVLHPQIEIMPHHWAKMRVEERIVASGIPFTILQPTAYMQNILANLDRIRRHGTFVTPYPVTTRISLVDLEDVGAIAARMLLEPGHDYATYQLVGTAPHDQREVAAVLSGALGFPVVAAEQSVEDWTRGAAQAGLGIQARETLAHMFRAYAQRGLSGNATVLTHLLGRAPTSLADMLVRDLARS